MRSLKFWWVMGVLSLGGCLGGEVCGEGSRDAQGSCVLAQEEDGGPEEQDPVPAEEAEVEDTIGDASGDTGAEELEDTGTVPVEDTAVEEVVVETGPYTIGNDTEFASWSNHTEGYLLGNRLTLESGCTLLSFGLIGKLSGPNVKMALYSDSENGPGELVAETSSTPVAVGPLEIPVSETVLVPGHYWVMAIYDELAAIGIDNGSSGSNFVAYRAQAFGDAMPNPFGAALTYVDRQFNYYLVVE